MSEFLDQFKPKEPSFLDQFKVAPVEAAAPLPIKTIDEVKASMSPEFEQSVVGSYAPPRIGSIPHKPDMDEVYAERAVLELFKGRFKAPELTLRRDAESMGRIMLDDPSLDIKGIHKGLIEKAQAGELDAVLDKSEWKQYGFSDKMAAQLNEFNNSDFVEGFMFAGKSWVKGLVKAVGGLAVGSGELILPKKLQDVLGVTSDRAWLNNLEQEQQMEILEYLEDGEFNKYVQAALVKTTGDMAGILKTSSWAMKAIGGATGGRLVLDDKTRKAAIASTTARAAIISTMNFIRTEGTLEERSKAQMLSFAYMMTPAISSGMETNLQAFLVDLGLNTIVTSVYDPEEDKFVLGGQYAGLEEESRELAEQMGHPEEWGKILLAKLIPIAGSDVIFSALTRSYQENARKPGVKGIAESARLLKQIGQPGFDAYKVAMSEKYGDQWLVKMSDSERMGYELKRAQIAAMEKGELPKEIFDSITPWQPRVAPRFSIEGGRVIVNDEDGVVTYRDSEGFERDSKGRRISDLTINGKEIPMAEQGKPAAEQAPVEQTAKPTSQIRELTGEDEVLLDKTFKEIFSQIKKTRSAVLSESAGQIKDYRKLVAALPAEERSGLLTALAGVVDAKTPEAKEKRQAALEKKVEVLAEAALRRDLVQTITKDAPRNIDPDYAESIRHLQDMINTDASPKNAWRLEQTRLAIGRHKDITLPEDLVKKLEKTSVNELSTKELVSMAEEVERLKKQGVVSQKLKAAQEKRRVHEMVSHIKSNLPPPTNKNRVIKDSKAYNKLGGLMWATRRPWNVVDMLDGGRAEFLGKAYEAMQTKPDEAYATYQRMTDVRVEAGERFIKALGLNVKELNAPVKIQGERFTIDQLLSVYASSKNKLMHNAVLHGNFKGNVTMYDDAVQYVASRPKLRSLAEYVMYDYAQNYNRLRSTVPGLGQEENYVPMVRLSVVDQSKSYEEMATDMLSRYDETRGSPDDRFTLDRVEVPEKYQTGVELGLYKMWEPSVHAQERFMNLFDSYKEMSQLVNNAELRKALLETHGKDYVQALDGYVKSFGNPMGIYDASGISSFVRDRRRAAALGVLSYNLLTPIKQIPSFLLYTGEAGPRAMAVALEDFNKAYRFENGKLVNDVYEFVAEKDPTLKHAHIERELADLKKMSAGKLTKVQTKLMEPGMKGIIYMDKATRAAGWYAVYLKEMNKHGNEELAVQKARDATKRTQPTAAAKDLPEMYKQGEVMNLFIMFSNQLNQIWNMATYDLPKKVQAGDIAGAAILGTGLAANALFMFSINNGRLPEDADDLGEMAMAPVPVVGSIYQSAKFGRDVGDILSTSVKRGIQTGDDLFDDPSGEAFWKWLQATGPISGMNFMQMERIRKTIETGDPGEAIGKGDAWRKRQQK